MKKLISIFTLICILATTVASLGITASAAEASWHSSFKAAGGGTVTKDGEFVTLTTNPEQEATSFTRNSWSEVNPQMDVEFDLQIKDFNTNAILVVFYTGQCRFYIHFNLDHIWGRGYAESGYEPYTVPYEIGYDMHHYQLITNGNVGDLYIDGYYAGTITGETNPYTPNTLQLNAGKKATATSFTFGNLKFNKYTGRKISGAEEQEEASTLLSKSWEYATLPNESVTYDFENPEDYAHWVLPNSWEVKDGILQSRNRDNLVHRTFIGAFPLEKGQDFTCSTRFKVDSFGEQQAILISWPDGSFRCYLYNNYIEFQTPHAHKRSSEISIEEGKWYELKLVVTENGTMNQAFLDGVPITGVEPAYDNNNHPQNGTISGLTYTNGSMFADLSFDWFQIDLVHNVIEMKEPMVGDEYLEDEKIPLAAIVSEEKMDEIPSVDYIVNGQVVATGYAPDYKAELPGFTAGIYDIHAEYGEHKTPDRTFSVRAGVLAEIQTSQDGYGNLFANLEFFDRRPQIAKVEYRLDGQVVATSDKAPYYEMCLSAVSPIQHTLEAICYDKAGIVVYEDATQFAGKSVETVPSENFANEVRYKVSGEFGAADVNYSNGRHQLKMTHSRSGVTYLTDEGEKTYDKGLGNFLVVTDGPFAEVYRNGQMVFTFVMPMTKAIEKSFQSNGLTITEESIRPSEDRATYFAMNNVTNKHAVYNLGNLPNYHVMEVVLDATDEGRLVLNDEYYRTDIQIEDGTVYAWTSKVELLDPFWKEVGKLSDWAGSDGKVYLRVETAIGMTRFYANGRWVFTCRSLATAGGGTLAVDVTGGDGFEYLCVGDNKDVYFYEDTFDGDTEYPSITQWQTQNSMVISIDPDYGHMAVGASGDDYAFAEVSAFAGDVDVSADVKILEGSDGFWFSFNHPVSHFYSIIGYNFKTKQFEVREIGKTGLITKTVDGSLPIGEYVNMSLKIRHEWDGKKVILYVNGEPMISTDDATFWRGRVGFVMKKGNAYIDNFKYRGDSKLVTDLSNNFTDTNVDLIDLGGDEFILSNKTAWRTTDNGKTFTQDTSIQAVSDNLVTLQNGDVLALKSELQYVDEDGKSYHNFIPYLSKDKGKSFQRLGNDKMSEKDHIGMTYNSMQNRIKQGPSGRVYAVCSTDIATEWWQHIQVFYSDDNGLTWNDSKTVIDNRELGKNSYDKPGFTFCELVPLELADGSVYLFGRTNLGYLAYLKSPDGGETFDVDTVYTTPFLSPEMCYSIEVDLYNPQHVYVVCGYDNDMLSGKGQYPRSRWMVARSTDSMKTWQVLGTVFENNAVLGAMMNTSIHITENAVVASAFSLDNFGTPWLGRTVAIPKDMQVGSNRFEQVQFKYPSAAENTRVVFPNEMKKTLVTHPESCTALLRNKRVEDASYDNYVSVDVAAAFVSASVSINQDGGIVFQTPGNEVIFQGNEVSEHNGKWYVDINAFAKAYSLFVADEKGTKIISPFENWSDLQKATFRFSLDFFSKE